MTDSNATTTRNVLYDFPDSPGETVTANLLTFLSVNGNEIFVVKSYPKVLDAENGTATHVLPVPTSGAWKYEWVLPDGNRPIATLAAGADIQLADVLAAALSAETANSLTDTFVLKAGDTMTGLLTLSGAPTADLHAATKKYVDDNAGGGASDIADLTATGESEDDILLVNNANGITGAHPSVVASLVEGSINILNIDGLGAGAGDHFRRNILDNSIEARTPAQVLGDIGAAAASDLTTHEGDTTNPHSVTAAQAGALPIPAGINTVASSRDIATTDAGDILEVTATAALNCPDGIGSNLQCAVVSIGGTTTITATTTLQYLDGGVQTAASGVTVNTQCTLYHRGSNIWLVMGDVTAI